MAAIDDLCRHFGIDADFIVAAAANIAPGRPIGAPLPGGLICRTANRRGAGAPAGSRALLVRGR